MDTGQEQKQVEGSKSRWREVLAAGGGNCRWSGSIGSGMERSQEKGSDQRWMGTIVGRDSTDRQSQASLRRSL